MLHPTCIEAIKKKDATSAAVANVHDDPNSISCSHAPTQCNVVGDAAQYACLSDRSTSPQRVYGALHGTKYGVLKK